MKVNDLNLCIGCMHQLNKDGTCSHCHFIQNDYYPLPRCLLPGTKLAERYILGSVLGQGNTGITYIGWDVVLELVIAIKEYYPSEMVSRDVIRGADKNVYVYEKEGKEKYQEKLKKFLDEARILMRFNQLNGIVSVRDFFYENNTAYIVMEYVDGISVKKHVERQGRIEGNRVLRLIRPMLTALGKVHNTGLIHRDISPDNILITKEDRLVLIDFGSARVRNADMTKSLTVVFKRGFSPEEQYRSRGKQGAWSDVYALCATMYYMLVGKAPDEAIERMLEDEMPSLLNMSDISLTIMQKSAIMKGISIHAKERYQNVAELYEALYNQEGGMEERDGLVKGKRIIYGTVCGVLLTIVISFSIYRLRNAPVEYEQTIHQNRSEVEAKQNIQKEATAKGEMVKSNTETESPQPTIQSYAMPSFIGMTKSGVNQAMGKIGNIEFDVIWEKEYNDKVKKGRVIRQSIEEGTECYPNQRMKLSIVISKGKKKAVVPDLVGKGYEMAVSELKKKRLEYKIVWLDSSLTKGRVLTQSEPSGTEVAIKTLIKIEVSNGKMEKKKVEENKNKVKYDFDGVIP